MHLFSMSKFTRYEIHFSIPLVVVFLSTRFYLIINVSYKTFSFTLRYLGTDTALAEYVLKMSTLRPRNNFSKFTSFLYNS